MLNFSSWRRPPHQTLILTSPIISIFRLLTQSPSLPDHIHDPPFSFASKTSTQKDNVKKKKKKKKKNENGESKKGQTFPLKSDLPFDFRYSYSETNPSVQPIGFREPPRFSPFGPGRLDRQWTGTSAPAEQVVDPAAVSEQRKAVLGEPLSEDEIAELVERYRHSDCCRQINLGKGGVTHNMLDDIHNHWKRAEAVRIKCLGVPTLDMENVCFHLEEKSGGRIIYRNLNIIILYRGRNYDPKNRPVVPLMLWKPYAPIYPRLVKPVADGLTFEETKEMRNRGLNSLPLMKLTRNGVYVNVVERVREEFRSDEVVRLDCTHVGTSDCKRIGVKLKNWKDRHRGPTVFNQLVHIMDSGSPLVFFLHSSRDVYMVGFAGVLEYVAASLLFARYEDQSEEISGLTQKFEGTVAWMNGYVKPSGHFSSYNEDVTYWYCYDETSVLYFLNISIG